MSQKEKLVQAIERDDDDVRKAFNQMRREIFELEKLKYRRMQEAAELSLGGADRLAARTAQPKPHTAAAGGKKDAKVTDDQNEDGGANNDFGVVANWKRVLIFAALLLLMQWQRIANMWQLAFNPPEAQKHEQSSEAAKTGLKWK